MGKRTGENQKRRQTEIGSGPDHPPPIARSHPDAMKEFQPSLRPAADNLRRAKDGLVAKHSRSASLFIGQ
jgi:hypothetical protein